MRCVLLCPFTNYSLYPSLKIRRSHQVRDEKWEKFHQSLPLPATHLGPLPGEQNRLPLPPSSAASFKTHRQELVKQKDLSSRAHEACGAAVLPWKLAVPEPSGVGASCLSRQWERGREARGGGHGKWAVYPAQQGSVHRASHGLHTRLPACPPGASSPQAPRPQTSTWADP